MRQNTAFNREAAYMAAKDHGFSVWRDHEDEISLSQTLRSYLYGTPIGQQLGDGHIGDVADMAAHRVWQVRHLQ